MHLFTQKVPVFAKSLVFLISVLILPAFGLEIRSDLGGGSPKSIVDKLPSGPNLAKTSLQRAENGTPIWGLPQSPEIVCTFDSVSRVISVTCEAEFKSRDSEKVGQISGVEITEKPLFRDSDH